MDTLIKVHAQFIHYSHNVLFTRPTFEGEASAPFGTACSVHSHHPGSKVKETTHLPLQSTASTSQP